MKLFLKGIVLVLSILIAGLYVWNASVGDSVQDRAVETLRTSVEVKPGEYRLLTEYEIEDLIENPTKGKRGVWPQEIFGSSKQGTISSDDFYLKALKVKEMQSKSNLESGGKEYRKGNLIFGTKAGSVVRIQEQTDTKQARKWRFGNPPKLFSGSKSAPLNLKPKKKAVTTIPES